MNGRRSLTLRHRDVSLLSASAHQVNVKQVPSVMGTDGYPHMWIVRLLVVRRFVRFWASGGAKFLKMGDSLPKTPMNHRAKFDAASFILAV